MIFFFKLLTYFNFKVLLWDRESLTQEDVDNIIQNAPTVSVNMADSTVDVKFVHHLITDTDPLQVYDKGRSIKHFLND